MKSKNLLLFIALALTGTALLAVNKSAGTTGFQFMKMTYSARALAMGNAFTALSDDPDAVHFNPAGLTQINSKQLKTNYINYLDGMNGGSAAYVMPDLNNYNLAFFVKYLNSGDIEKTELTSKDAYVQNGTFSASNLLLGISVAKTINENLDLGLTAKFDLEQLDDESASAVAFDLGILHQTKNEKLKIGASLKNVGKQITYYSDSEYNEKMPTEASLGAKFTFNEKTLAVLDVNKPLDNDVYAKFGLEHQLIKILTLRAGFDSRAGNYRAGGDYESVSGISAGFGVNYRNYMVDYGIASMGGLGWNNQISLTIKL
jgi:hypothetical protein